MTKASTADPAACSVAVQQQNVTRTPSGALRCGNPLVSVRHRRIGGENGGRQADEPVCSKHEWEPKLPPTFLWFKPEQLIELTLELHKRGPDQSFSLLILRGFGDDVLGRD